MPPRLDELDVRRGRALRPLLGLIAHPRALGKRLEAAALNRAVMNEQILAAVIRRDEAEPLLVAEPLHSSCSHLHFPPGSVLRNTEGTGGTTTRTRTHLLIEPVLGAAARRIKAIHVSSRTGRGLPHL